LDRVLGSLQRAQENPGVSRSIQELFGLRGVRGVCGGPGSTWSRVECDGVLRSAAECHGVPWSAPDYMDYADYADCLYYQDCHGSYQIAPDGYRLPGSSRITQIATERHRETRRDTEIHGDTRRYTEIHGDTRRYPEIPGDTRRYTEMPGDTRRYTEIHGDTRRARRPTDYLDCNRVGGLLEVRGERGVRGSVWKCAGEHEKGWENVDYMDYADVAQYAGEHWRGTDFVPPAPPQLYGYSL